MKKLLVFALVLSAGIQSASAQSSLFGETKHPARSGFVFSVNGALDMPGADMAKRFGSSYKLGGAIWYKTTSNWMFGPKIDFIIGSKIKEDSLLQNIQTFDGFLVNQSGLIVDVGKFERGYMIGLQASKIINISKTNGDNGILITTSAGFMQHKINLYDQDKSILQIKGDYRKGYDRLTNGTFVEQYIGYNHMGSKGFLNFHIGLDLTAGFTKGRRDYLYDVMRPGTDSRVDLLFGIRGGWYIPIFKRKSEEIFFD
ncbi:MAG: hypothetical protein EOP51_03605 [Sphingobacteriales bacterium]|nr:MAG: hypothetical protein EOP51_03605 [Sphingobacteriales bacterium]